VIWLLLLLGCTPEPTPFELVLPEGFPEQQIPEDNLLTHEGVALGRTLYYDSALDGRGLQRACADCHLQDQGFSSTEGVGVLPHVNLGWTFNFQWDGAGGTSLEEAMDLSVVQAFAPRAKDLEHLTDDFWAAFAEAPSDVLAGKAVAQFLRTLNSGNSRYDQFERGEIALTDAELRGRYLYFSEDGDCFHCHGTVLLTDDRFHNNGLDSDVAGTGRETFTDDPLDAGKYKTPTLRNIAVTAPYMHDDRFDTLEEVVAFYATGLQNSETIDPLMKWVHQGGVQIGPIQQADLVAFLRTFTDEDFLTDSAFSAP
jgi:cytochrome c peroxidase